MTDPDVLPPSQPVDRTDYRRAAVHIGHALSGTPEGIGSIALEVQADGRWLPFVKALTYWAVGLVQRATPDGTAPQEFWAQVTATAVALEHGTDPDEISNTGEDHDDE
ncbi:hypothetical protein [Promicromonospora iranensis]|uniref:Uncharacterized protein n=1 Tax=Promicromonospora iranensis TaxID=1105144 RepID=A0ABU2CWG4_9MICO|nr:hypothetical protein [Promicromonospora iranensis]MDR7385683.1 hypothetical protein [Promicromonospora iranensis]